MRSWHEPLAHRQSQPDGKVSGITGLKKVRQHGSHIFFRHADGRTGTVPYHKGGDLGHGITNKILHDADVSRETFLAWLEKKA